MTTADIVKRACNGATAYTLAGGYATFGNGTRRLFEAGRQAKERRNEAGRVTYAEYTYRDGSRLVFRYHPQHGARLV